MIVVDASLALELLLHTQAGVRLERRIAGDKLSLHAPHLVDVEVMHVLRRYVRADELSPARGRAAIEDLADLRMTRYPHDLLLPRMWELRNNLTGYDAAYVALAELLEAPLVTRDARLAGAAGHVATIEVV